MSGLAKMEERLIELAQEVAKTLAELNKKCVFAESCTGGKMASALTSVPGISNHFCGSAVTYREATKTQWLGIAESELQKHTAESEAITVEMARQIMANTPEADFAVAITGHLGPGIDSQIDGKIFVIAAMRRPPSIGFISTQHMLASTDRQQRQAEAACLALEDFLHAIGSDPAASSI